ncbi:MAG TPA: lysophospholipid acyltransferase family protein [Pyrinomonadaceae bacterium]|jgi:1-acyl-sn-glycerol-3-phosphate acyltransferase|nr:lysophospholipid acyltransferase family protein [Pyrinomonadaceae bacterium]
MTDHAENLFLDLIERNEKIVFSAQQSNISAPDSPTIGSGAKLIGKLRYWWCWLVVTVLLLFIATPLLIFTALLNRRYWVYPWAIWGAGFWLKACGTKLVVKGLENLDPERSYVFISNHRSYLDTATLFICTGRRMGLVAKKELLKVPVLGPGMAFVNVLAIDRSNPQRAIETIDKARDVLAKGFSFGIFAEGTRAMPGELLPFKKGAFHLAIQTEAPIVPVAIKNTDRLMGKKTGLMFPGTIEVVLFPAIETKNLSTKTELKPLMDKVRGVIAEELAKTEG